MFANMETKDYLCKCNKQRYERTINKGSIKR